MRPAVGQQAQGVGMRAIPHSPFTPLATGIQRGLCTLRRVDLCKVAMDDRIRVCRDVLKCHGFVRHGFDNALERRVGKRPKQLRCGQRLRSQRDLHVRPLERRVTCWTPAPPDIYRPSAHGVLGPCYLSPLWFRSEGAKSLSRMGWSNGRLRTLSCTDVMQSCVAVTPKTGGSLRVGPHSASYINNLG